MFDHLLTPQILDSCPQISQIQIHLLWVTDHLELGEDIGSPLQRLSLTDTISEFLLLADGHSG
jgi:hypothetical protein